MENLTLLLFWGLLAYLIGAIPFGYLIGKWQGLDIRTLGSRNIGATNVARVLGKAQGRAVFALDFLKGLLPTWLTHYFIVQYTSLGALEVHSEPSIFTNSSDLWFLLYFLLPILGHLFPVFLKFKGGKGVATAAGILAGLSPLTFISILTLFGAVFYKFRIISAASLSAAVMLPVMFILTTQPFLIEILSPPGLLGWVDILGLTHRSLVTHHAMLFLLGWIGISLWVIIRHRTNIKRLLSGTEHPFK